MKFFNTDKIPYVLGELVPRAQPAPRDPVVTLKSHLTLNKDTGLMAYCPPVPAGAEVENSVAAPPPVKAAVSADIDATTWKSTPPAEPGWYVASACRDETKIRYWSGDRWSYATHQDQSEIEWLRKVVM